MTVQRRLARLWIVTLVLALVVGPGLVPAGAQDLVQDGLAGPGESTAADDGTVDLSGDPLAEGAGLGTDAGWWAAVQEEIRQSEYEVTWQEHTYLTDLPAAYQAPNRAHNLRTYFEPTGIRVHDRTASASPALLELRLVDAGREGALAPVGAGSVVSDGHRVTSPGT